MVKGIKLGPINLDGIGKPLGGRLQRITSPGKRRYRAEISLPPQDSALGRLVIKTLTGQRKKGDQA